MELMKAFHFVLYAYLAIWIAKSILALADAHVAAGAFHQKTGRPLWLLLAGIVIYILVTTLLLWPKLLVAERGGFFLTYSRFSVIRQVVQAYRDVDSGSSEKVV